MDAEGTDGPVEDEKLPAAEDKKGGEDGADMDAVSSLPKRRCPISIITDDLDEDEDESHVQAPIAALGADRVPAKRNDASP